MPLLEGHSAETRSKNIAELIHSGYPPKQAEAIAYKKSGEDEESARMPDENGWIEIKGNPISKVGVFEYLGAQIDDSLVPDKVYNVFRPEEELADQACIDSFKLVPWTDDHEMLGAFGTPAEQKGIHGVVGEDVYFEDGYLKGNLKIFSEKLSDLIKKGKKELSIGYRCLYDLTSGVYQGKRYDAIQRKLRGNHLASVDEGRSGHDVAVLDKKDIFKITLDTKGFNMNEKIEAEKEQIGKDEMSLESLAAEIAECRNMIKELMAAPRDEKENIGIDEESTEKTVTGHDTEEEMVEDKEGEEKDMKDSDKKDGMDAAVNKRIDSLQQEIESLKKNALKKFTIDLRERNKLVDSVVPHVGVFDSAGMTAEEVAVYAAKKLNLTCAPGQAQIAVSSFLAGKNSHQPVMDATSAALKQASGLDKYFK